MTNTRFIVRCEDGAIRHHSDSFPTREDALRWADWGHACTAVSRHRVEEVETVGSAGCIVLRDFDGATLWDCECRSCQRLVAQAEAEMEV